ncbi:hypothetical protein LTR94_029398, partial [Friedmanniomyces endolithicus]
GRRPGLPRRSLDRDRSRRTLQGLASGRGRRLPNPVGARTDSGPRRDLRRPPRASPHSGRTRRPVAPVRPGGGSCRGPEGDRGDRDDGGGREPRHPVRTPRAPDLLLHRDAAGETGPRSGLPGATGAAEGRGRPLSRHDDTADSGTAAHRALRIKASRRHSPGGAVHRLERSDRVAAARRLVQSGARDGGARPAPLCRDPRRTAGADGLRRRRTACRLHVHLADGPPPVHRRARRTVHRSGRRGPGRAGPLP